MPGRPPERRASRLQWRVGEAMVGEDGLDISGADPTQAVAGTAGPDGRQEPVLVIGTQDDRDPGRRLLERLEQGALGVLVHAMGRLDDGDAWPRPPSA